MKPRSKTRSSADSVDDESYESERDAMFDENCDDEDFECFVEEVSASESSGEEYSNVKSSPKKKAVARTPNRRFEKKNKTPQSKSNKNGDEPRQKKFRRNQPVKVNVEDEEQLATKGRRSIKPAKFSEYVMLIDSSENQNSSSDDDSSCEVSEFRGRTRAAHIIDDSDDESSGSQLMLRKSRRKRKKCLTLKEKINILRRFDAIQPCSQKEALKLFGIRQTTFSTIVANREELENRYVQVCDQESSNDDIKTLEEAVIDYVKKEDANGATVSWEHIKEKSQELKEKLNLDEFVGDGWLERWKNNFDVYKTKLPISGIVSPELLASLAKLEQALSTCVETSRKNGVELTWNKLKSECQSLAESFGLGQMNITDEWLIKWKSKFEKQTKRPYRRRGATTSMVIDQSEEDDDWSGAVRAALKDYHPDNVFNAVESGLYYKSLPGAQNSNTDWLTVLFACNMSGTEKKKLLVISKLTNQLMLGILTLPVDFRTNEGAWMTSEIFTEFVTEWDRTLGQSRRRIALIVEACPVHTPIELKWIKMFFVPQKNNDNQPPLKRGVISSVKTLYRKQLAKSVKKLSKDSSHVGHMAEKISVVDAAFMLSGAWADVTKSSMVTAFVQSGFPFLQSSTYDNQSDEDDDVDINHLNSDDERIIVHEEPRDVHAALLVDGHQGCINEVIVHADEESITDEPPNYSDHQDGCDEAGNGCVALDSSIPMKSDSFEREKSNRLSDVDGCKRDVTSPFLRATSSNSSLTEDAIWSLSQTSSSEVPSDAKVFDALATIKRFLKLKSGTLEDLTDYTQLELKVLAKLQSQ